MTTHDRRSPRQKRAWLQQFAAVFLLAALAHPSHAQQGAASPTVPANLDQAATAMQRPFGASVALPEPELVPEDFSRMPLAPGTLLDLRIYRVPEMSGPLRIDDDGAISVPLLGKVAAAGKTPAALSAELAERFGAQGWLADPQVNIDVLQYTVPSTSVLGEVQTPGHVPLHAPKPLTAVLAMAGGETISAGSEIEVERAHGREGAPAQVEHITYAREDSPESIANVTVDPGDTVFVHRAGIVYVLGAVTRPGGYLMVDRGSLTLTEALSLAQGTSLIASTRQVWIVRRGEHGEPAMIPVDYPKIVRGKVPAPNLQSEDVVYVAVSKFKASLVNGSAVLSAATSASIYAGTSH